MENCRYGEVENAKRWINFYLHKLNFLFSLDGMGKGSDAGESLGISLWENYLCPEALCICLNLWSAEFPVRQHVAGHDLTWFDFSSYM